MEFILTTFLMPLPMLMFKKSLEKWKEFKILIYKIKKKIPKRNKNKSEKKKKPSNKWSVPPENTADPKGTVVPTTWKMILQDLKRTECLSLTIMKTNF